MHEKSNNHHEGVFLKRLILSCHQCEFAGTCVSPCLFCCFFFISADFIVFIPLHCNVLLCRFEACTLLEKIKRILFVCTCIFS